MTERRALCGMLPVDKPAGMTSHDVVMAVRRSSGVRRVGHCGTLDPIATGLLVLAVGPATRLTRFLLASEKSYEAVIALGRATDTMDAEGEVVTEAPVPDAALDEARVREVLEQMVGTMLQRPPAYSAVKVRGRPAHRLARAGIEVDLEPRTVTIRRARLLAIEREPVTWRVEFVVSKGTYVRVLAAEAAQRMGTVGHLSGLRRTASGGITVERAHPLPEILELAGRGRLSEAFIPAREALPLPAVEITPKAADDLGFGRTIRYPEGDGDTLEDDADVLAVTGDRVIAVCRAGGGLLRPTVVLPGGCP